MQTITLEWINNKVPLYSTGNNIQYPVINQNWKNMKKNIHLCTTESLALQKKFSSVQSFSRVRLFATPWTAPRQAPLSTTNSQSLLKLMSIESVMTSNHLILCRPLLLLPSIFPSIRVFFQWVSSLHQVVKVLELQLQHQSFQWIFRTDFL